MMLYPQGHIHRVGQTLTTIAEHYDNFPHDDRLARAIDVLHSAWKAGKPVLFAGNGGSGATCSHICNDLQKNVGHETGRPLKAMCLSDAVPLVSAIANDVAWADVFAAQVATWGEPGAVLVAVSGSGNSENVLQAVKEAKRNGMAVLGLSGFDGGRLAKMCDLNLNVGTDSMQVAEDVHSCLLHALFLGLVEKIKREASGG